MIWSDLVDISPGVSETHHEWSGGRFQSWEMRGGFSIKSSLLDNFSFKHSKSSSWCSFRVIARPAPLPLPWLWERCLEDPIQCQLCRLQAPHSSSSSFISSYKLLIVSHSPINLKITCYLLFHSFIFSFQSIAISSCNLSSHRNEFTRVKTSWLFFELASLFSRFLVQKCILFWFLSLRS